MIGHECYMRQALLEAAKARGEGEVPVGAVMVRDGRIIGRGHNQIKTLKDPTAHAEMIAITQAASYFQNERLNGCLLYVTIEPCPMCVFAALLARIKSIIFGARDPRTGACGSAVDLTKPALFNHTLEVTGGTLEPECRNMLREFFLAKR